MAEIFLIVRLATLILSGIALVFTILGLIDTLGHEYGNKTQALVSQIIVLAITFLGVWGSWKNNRVYLLVFALILIIATIVGALGVPYYWSVGFNVLLAVLALCQAELLRRGYA